MLYEARAYNLKNIAYVSDWCEGNTKKEAKEAAWDNYTLKYIVSTVEKSNIRYHIRRKRRK